MGSKRNRLPPENMAADRHALIGVQSLTDYTPMTTAFSPTALADLQRAMDEARDAEVRAQHALATARDMAALAEWAFHDGILGAKAQVIAQYGPDSQAVQTLGLKRKSERRRATRRPPPTS